MVRVSLESSRSSTWWRSWGIEVARVGLTVGFQGKSIEDTRLFGRHVLLEPADQVQYVGGEIRRVDVTRFKRGKGRGQAFSLFAMLPIQMIRSIRGQLVRLLEKWKQLGFLPADVLDQLLLKIHSLSTHRIPKLVVAANHLARERAKHGRLAAQPRVVLQELLANLVWLHWILRKPIDSPL